MDKRPGGRDEFEIAIVCALPLEVDAVHCLVDDFWPNDYQKATGDPNHYTNCRIGKFNVVLVLLPDIGKVHASGAASYLTTSYTNLRLALLVGICGGVPRPNQGEARILLGDVVISNALIQFDFGRRYPGGRFLRKNSARHNFEGQNKDIRASLRNLETERYRDDLERRTADLLQELQAAYANRARNKRRLDPDKYKYPGTAHDVLFEARYQHRHRGPAVTCCRETDTCEAALRASCKECGCDEAYLVRRDHLDERRNIEQDDPIKAQEPTIYLGSVASGDTVMKSGEDRDRIAKEEEVIAFEMEGAGIWDKIPCIIIKGVCDYADAHKNKGWQNFAAATAAAVTKALLETFVEMEKPRTELQVVTARLQTMDPQIRSRDMLPQERALEFVCRWLQAEGRIGKQLPMTTVLVIDSRGCDLPFHLETISTKEAFIQVLKDRFTDIGTKKIDRHEWCLEDQGNGQLLDLSKPWQSIIKPNQVLKMRMVFRRQNENCMECPSCNFKNLGSSSDEIQCRRCGLSYRRVEEIQNIQISSHPSKTTTNKPESVAETKKTEAPSQFTRPRPPRQLEGDEIHRYKHIQLVDIDFKISQAGQSQQPIKTARLLSLHHLHDPEELAEDLANTYGLSGPDSLSVAKMAIRSFPTAGELRPIPAPKPQKFKDWTPNSALEDYQSQLMLPRERFGGREPTERDMTSEEWYALQDYRMQMMLLEQQHKKRLSMARMEWSDRGGY